MSYDIYFIKKNDLNLENVHDVLEELDPTPEDEIFISQNLKESLVNQIKDESLVFDEVIGRSSVELNFSTYQVSMFDSQVAISLPYWDENNDQKIHKEVKTIINIFLKNKLVGFDPQTEEFITDLYEFQSFFVETQPVIKKALSERKDILAKTIQDQKYIKEACLCGVILILTKIFVYLIGDRSGEMTLFWDVVIISILTYGIYKKILICGILLLTLFSFSFISQITAVGIANISFISILISLTIIYYLIRGNRALFRDRKIQKNKVTTNNL